MSEQKPGNEKIQIFTRHRNNRRDLQNDRKQQSNTKHGHREYYIFIYMFSRWLRWLAMDPYGFPI